MGYRRRSVTPDIQRRGVRANEAAPRSLTLATLIVFRPRCYLGLVLTNHLMDIVGCWLVCFVCRFGDLPQQTVAAQVET